MAPKLGSPCSRPLVTATDINISTASSRQEFRGLRTTCANILEIWENERIMSSMTVPLNSPGAHLLFRARAGLNSDLTHRWYT